MNPPFPSWARKYGASLIVLALGLAGTFTASGMVRRIVVEQDRIRFENTVDNLRMEIQQRIGDLEELAYSGQVLFNASDLVSAAEWATFTRTPFEALRSPTLMAFGYAEGAPRSGPHLYRVRFLEPPARRPAWIGKHLRFPAPDPSDPSLPQVELEAECPVGGDPCARISLPHLRVDGRVLGWLFLQFRLNRLVADSIEGIRTQYHLRIDDIPSDPDHAGERTVERMPPTHRHSHRDGFPHQRTIRIDVLRHQRDLTVRGGLSFRETPGLLLPWAILLIGLIATAVFVFLVQRASLQRLRAERGLSESEERYRTVLEHSPDAIFILDRRRFLYANPAACRLSGAPSIEDLYDHAVTDLVHPADRPLFRERFARPSPGLEPSEPLAVRFVGLDGILRWTETLCVSGRHEGRDSVFIFARDITERQLADQELRETLEILKRNNRELQDFAFVASHDLQEPLRKIQSFSGFLRAELGGSLPERAADYLSRMVNAAGRMQTLIEGLLAYSRITTQARPFKPVDMDLIVREVVADLDDLVTRSGGRVESRPLPPLEADPIQMRQLLQNLIGNALKFQQEGNPPVVRIHARVEGDPPLYRLLVEDNGIGFDPKYAERIFNVFQRLHGRGEFDGTGIGLAICRRIAERHGGTITARSTLGQGATFIVELPARQAHGDEG